MEISLSLSFSFFSSSSSSGGCDEALSGWLPRCANQQLASANSGDSPAHSLAYPLPNQHAPPMISGTSCHELPTLLLLLLYLLLLLLLHLLLLSSISYSYFSSISCPHFSCISCSYFSSISCPYFSSISISYFSSISCFYSVGQLAMGEH